MNKEYYNNKINTIFENLKNKYNNSEKVIEEPINQEKEAFPIYLISDFNFDIETRNCHILFLRKQYYRTIEKYITQNYIKYPVYSEWKIRNKNIKKSIKLTNETLENLQQNEDILIKTFAEEIVMNTNRIDLIPSWLIIKEAIKEYDSNKDTIIQNLNNYTSNINMEIDNLTNNIQEININISKTKKKLNKKLNKSKKLNTKINTIKNKEKNILKSILTLGIYNYALSTFRKNKITNKIMHINNIINSLNSNISKNNNIISDLTKKIDNLKNQSKIKEETTNNKLIELEENHNEFINGLKPLMKNLDNTKNFIPLKNFIGINGESFKGCYIIRNKENDKYYVGQSKDVYKRIKQHFKGTVPKNTIFAEDYYTSNFKNKEDIFEIKIIKCETKDELDKLEKDLIYKYDSWNNGYNGTSGNI